LRILHTDSGHQMRGGQWQVLYLLDGLAALGHEQLLMAPPDSPLAHAATERGIATAALSISNLAARHRNFDLLHAHDAHSHALAAPFARGRLLVARRVAFGLKKSPTTRWKYKRAAHFIAVSQFVCGVLVRDGVNPERISVLYDGVPLGEEPAELPGDRVIAIDSGDPLKGRTLMEQAAELSGIPVHFSSDLSRDLPHAAVFVYITAAEGLGSAALLAAARAVPVVASRIGGLPEAVEDGVTGLLTDNDPQAIAAAILRLTEDRSLARQMGAAGRRRVAERFTIEAMVRGTIEVYEKVLACPQP
jgi:hypothetical protein